MKSILPVFATIPWSRPAVCFDLATSPTTFAPGPVSERPLCVASFVFISTCAVQRAVSQVRVGAGCRPRDCRSKAALEATLNAHGFEPPQSVLHDRLERLWRSVKLWCGSGLTRHGRPPALRSPLHDAHSTAAAADPGLSACVGFSLLLACRSLSFDLADSGLVQTYKSNRKELSTFVSIGEAHEDGATECRHLSFSKRSELTT